MSSPQLIGAQSVGTTGEERPLNMQRTEKSNTNHETNKNKSTQVNVSYHQYRLELFSSL